MCTTSRRRRCGADDDARSHKWAVSGGSDTIGSSYGPIGIVVSLGSGGRGEEGSRNVGGAAAIWAVSTRRMLVLAGTQCGTQYSPEGDTQRPVSFGMMVEA